MADFLTTNGISYHIEKVITEANKKLVLVSPYLQISKTLQERLIDASKRDVSIKIIYGKDQLNPNEKKTLNELVNLELFYLENLHAKCYFNEREMVITSMNMYEFSEKNNREMGVFVSRDNDKNLFDNAVKETFSIIQSSKIIQLTKTIRKVKTDKGFCIRCKEGIKYNIDKPYCRECFAIWFQFENVEYEESFCHQCGRDEYTSMIKPECYKCYKSNN